MTFKYEIILYWSRADGVFVAEVPELPGCMAYGSPRRATRSRMRGGGGRSTNATIGWCPT